LEKSFHPFIKAQAESEIPVLLTKSGDVKMSFFNSLLDPSIFAEITRSSGSGCAHNLPDLATIVKMEVFSVLFYFDFHDLTG